MYKVSPENMYVTSQIWLHIIMFSPRLILNFSSPSPKNKRNWESTYVKKALPEIKFDL